MLMTNSKHTLVRQNSQ